MRTRLPAALLLLLSWFLPASGHAQLAGDRPAVQSSAPPAVAGGHDPTLRAAGHPGARRSPYQPPTAHSWTASYDATGGSGPVVLPADAPTPGRAWADVVRRHGGADPVARRQAATPARAPPSTGL